MGDDATRQAEELRILVVDDDEALLRAEARILRGAGYEVQTAPDGAAAARALASSSFAVIFSDIDMPGMDGLELLEVARRRDLDVPVVLITGRPSVETAARAIEAGALRYLVKPVDLALLVRTAADAVRLRRIALAKRQALELASGGDRFVGDRAGLTASFDRALESLYMVYQPIVSWSARSVYAYEALLRTREPSLPHPAAVIDAADRLGRVHELGRRVRAKAIAPPAPLPEGALLFLNLHPADLEDDDLYRREGALASMAHRVVLEITERASLDGIRDVRARVAELRGLGFRVAVDDLGAGYAGLTSFTLLEPDVVKLDMGLVRGIAREPKKATVVKMLTTMCKELGIVVTSEGIEVAEERDELARVGCDLMQGFLFARPDEAFPRPAF